MADRTPSSRTIPRTSETRLERAATDTSYVATELPRSTADSDTVLYLAYGSNLAAETFLGVRGIRPLSQVNASVPTLSLTFSLPGMPYREPCFGNIEPRKIPLPDPTDPINPPPPPPPPPPPSDDDASFPPGNPIFEKGLYGIVYEVTPADWVKILSSEGGGMSYHVIQVPCFALPPAVSIPEKPRDPLQRPFLARTLYAPRLPPPPGDGDGGRLRWWQRLALPPQRPHQDYAQPSLRYLALLRDGAAEHDLPLEYQEYLAGLQPYTPTTARQRAGLALLTLLWGPWLLLFWAMARLVTDRHGQLPTWMAASTAVCFNLMWASYDLVLKRLFGEGEHTLDGMERERCKNNRASNSQTPWRWSRGEKCLDEEARALIGAEGPEDNG